MPINLILFPDLRQLLTSNYFTKRFSRCHVTIATPPTSRISDSPEGLRCGLNTPLLAIPHRLQDFRNFLSQVRSRLIPRGSVHFENLTVAHLLIIYLTFYGTPKVHYHDHNTLSQMNLIDIVPPCFLSVNFNENLPSSVRSSKKLLPCTFLCLLLFSGELNNDHYNCTLPTEGKHK
jgi:hypothetical protein